MSLNKDQYYTAGSSFVREGNKKMLNAIQNNAYKPTRKIKSKKSSFVNTNLQNLKCGGKVLKMEDGGQLPKYGNGDDTVSLGPAYDSRYGFMGKLAYDKSFRGQRDRSTQHTLYGDVYGGNFGLGVSGAHKFGSERRNAPVFGFAQNRLGYDPIRGAHYDFSGGADIHLLNDRYKGKLDVTPYGGVWAQSKADTRSINSTDLGSKVGLNYGVDLSYKKPLGDGSFGIKAGVSASPSLGKLTSQEKAESGRVEFAPQVNVGVNYSLPIGGKMQKMKRIARAKKKEEELKTTPRFASNSSLPKFLKEGGITDPPPTKEDYQALVDRSKLLQDALSKYGYKPIDNLKSTSYDIIRSRGQESSNYDGSWQDPSNYMQALNDINTRSYGLYKQEQERGPSMFFTKKQLDAWKEDMEKYPYRKDINSYQFEQRNLIGMPGPGEINYNLPPALYDKRITPSNYQTYSDGSGNNVAFYTYDVADLEKQIEQLNSNNDLPKGFNYWYDEMGRLDPEVYGYAKSDIPRQISQPIQKSNLKRKMKRYAKTGEYPWGRRYKFQTGGEVMELTDEEIQKLRAGGAIVIES